MKIRNTKLLQLTMLTIAGAAFAISCNKGKSSSSEQSSADVTPSKVDDAKLTVSVPVAQITAKVGAKKEQVILIKNEGTKPATNIVLSGLSSPFTIKPAVTPVEPAKEDSPAKSDSASKPQAQAKTEAPIKPAVPAKTEEETTDPSKPVEPTKNACEIKALAPGESCEVTIEFAPEKVGSGKETLTVQYMTEGKALSSASDIAYLAKGKIELEIPTLPQFQAEVRKPVTQTLTIKNNGEEAITGLKIAELTAPLSSKSTCKDSLEVGATCDIEITFNPLEVVSSLVDLKISYNDIDEDGNEKPVTATTQLSYQTTGIANLTIESTADYLIANVNSSATRTYTIKNAGNGKATKLALPVLVSPLKIGATTCKAELDKDQSCTFDVVLTADKDNYETAGYAMAVVYNDGKAQKTAISNINFKSVPANVLNLSQYKVATASIEIGTICKTAEVYGNGSHNIPLVSTFTGTDINGKKVEVKLADVMKSTQVQLVAGGVSIEAPGIKAVKDAYSKCIDGSSIPEGVSAVYLTSKANGQTLDVGAKLSYVEKDGKVSSVSTDNYQAGRIKVDVKDNPFLKIAADSLYSIGIIADDYSSGLVTRDNYRLFRIAPNLKDIPSLSIARVAQIQITNTNQNKSSNWYQISADKFSTDLAWFDQGQRKTFMNNQYRREFYSGKFLNGSLKGSETTVNLSKNKSTNLTLAQITSQDFALASISDSGMPSWVGNYQWHLPFKIEMQGTDSFGNQFTAVMGDNF
ncbi:choice-of-anchor D domain-containing protein [Pigmentibacter ruber]